jgi:hypothetical protein
MTIKRGVSLYSFGRSTSSARSPAISRIRPC